MDWAVTADELFGEVAVLVDRAGGVIEVCGERIPRARLRRVGDGQLEPGCLIGTREAGRLEPRADSGPAVVTPGRGVLTRRSFGVDVITEGGAGGTGDRRGRVRHRLVPDGSRSSALYRDGGLLGRLTADPDALLLSAEWSPGVTSPGVTSSGVTSPGVTSSRAGSPGVTSSGVTSSGVEVRPADAALGYLLAAAFGTGARHPLYVLYEIAECLLPA